MKNAVLFVFEYIFISLVMVSCRFFRDDGGVVAFILYGIYYFINPIILLLSVAQFLLIFDPIIVRRMRNRLLRVSIYVILVVIALAGGFFYQKAMGQIIFGK